MSRPRGDSVASSSLDGFDDLDTDYDVVSASGLSGSLASLPGPAEPEPTEPEPSAEARAQFMTASLTAEDVRAYARNALRARGVDDAALARLERPGRTVRVYVDGAFDALDAGYALSMCIVGRDAESLLL
jgi:choline-phosphate cytidylyltransferase